MESYNNVFGECRNPYNKERIVGGSSGGEACLIKLGVVNSALGSDIAGSLRIPALLCGITAFKPTEFRISGDSQISYFLRQNWAKKLPNRSGILKAVVGPMAKTVSECEILMKVLIEAGQEDFRVPPLFWNPVKMPKKYGYLKPFSLAPLSPANERAYN